MSPADCLAGETFGGSQRCRDCHDFAPADHVERLLMGSHGISAEAGFTRGCEDCHGPSEAHAEAPREVAPAVSFGPRWRATSAAQDSACLACHESDVAENWQHALHMHNELTCVICHDIHSDGDTVLLPEQQAGVCITCHKAQESGIHGLGGDDLSAEPPCSSCHNPHNHENAGPQMLANESLGCRTCHDLEAMLDNPLLPAKTRDYHLAAQKPGRTCLDCHQGIAHGPTGAAPLRPDNLPTQVDNP
jgi:DmsE family decaheme c-type cytochrome